ncbi:Cytochrome P450 [Croceitalea dokdonensis DOKDO 023]|uniref:Cytochrome P450 n=1 Tax=Croceitalea dokdonensis DOKDO 023 TaxID=1300341 RepID=A0A0N8H3S0_9FLAO|nr:Cytochrome P450 [Croceitalea dokdonensis DOKDO 023]
MEEGLRLYPPAYVIDRIANREDQFNGTTIKKGTLFLMSIYELHRYEAFWEDPLAFKPERFEAQNQKKYQEYYYPFGAGPRMCVGNNFAMFEMMMVIAEVLKKYRITTDAPIEINPLISLKPKQMNLYFELR